MRFVLYPIMTLLVLSLGFWVYREHYATLDALNKLRALQDEIAQLREDITLQRAEWAYLNRPDRLRALTTFSVEQTQLVPLRPDQLGAIKDLPYPELGETRPELDADTP